jgi:preprotein translocase subunit SecF
MINIIKNRKISFTLSAVLFVTSLVILVTFGLKPGIDFTGGSLIELSFTGERPEIQEVHTSLETLDFDLGVIKVQPTDDDAMMLKMRFITEEEHQAILSNIRGTFETKNTNVDDLNIEDKNFEVITTDDSSGTVVADVDLDFLTVVEDDTVENSDDLSNRVLEDRVETIGPAISSQLRSRAIYAAIAVIFAIIFYVAYAFRKVSKPVQSWKYGITAIIALIHDVTITMAVFALLGRFAGVEIDIPFVVALLTILGYSVNDTIVVFDRVRENLIKRGSENFAETVNLGVNETLVRSVNTSITTLVVLVSLFLFGGASIHYFSLALIIGILLGTYSSIFLASPLLVVWKELKEKRV